ncbi:MAG TPA: NAD(P)-dependent oxidoreductase [Burkholderiaceae bacterium]|nr:NAD(P)-dependent oxidoreductase [Burkholderiaceae bacterium]
MKIGFVGLGAMGAPMAARLVAAGHEVAGFDMRREAVEALVKAGGRAAASAAEAAEGAELLWLMVVTGEQAREVLFAQGAAAALPRGAIVALGCTQAPALAQATAGELEALGLAMLDAPVSGGAKRAAEGALTIMASAPEAVFARAKPVMEAMGQRVFDCGRTIGLGSTAKMVNQLLCGVHIAAAAEALHLAERAGMDPARMLEVIGVSAGNSWMFGDRGPRMLQADPGVTSAVDIFVKDLGIVLGEGRTLKAGLPLSAAAMQMFLAASGLGHGAADDSQVIRAYRALNGAGAKR